MIVYLHILLCLIGLLLSMIRSDYGLAIAWFVGAIGWMLLALETIKK